MRKPVKLKALSAEDYTRLVKRSSSDFDMILSSVIPIISAVKEKGDEAVLEFTRKFDKVNLTPDSLKVPTHRIKEAYKKVSSDVVDSLEKMRRQVESFHLHQLPAKWEIEKWVDSGSVTMGELPISVRRAGIYVPGGKASYPSTVIMGCVPAKLAGVEQTVVCTPPSSDGSPPPEVMVAFDIAGGDVLISAGGAQAIAALAYGTETIPKVDLVVGPGNVYVNAAKVYLALRGEIGIDCSAGPSEVLIIADDTAPSSWVVWDLLAQVEHDEFAWGVVLTTSENLAREVHRKIKEELANCVRKKIIESSLNKNGFILIVEDLEEAIDFANEFAPEHLEIFTADPERYLHLIKNAGSVFLGPFSPVAAGDYGTGVNHILPTGGVARFSSGLSIQTFIKRVYFQYLSSDALSFMKEPISSLARHEGFQAHLKSIEVRFKKKKEN